MQSTASYSPNAKVWVYQASRPFSQEEIILLNNKLASFAVQWTAHNKQLNAMGEVYADRFVILMVDETHTAASGCSIDSSVHFIKELENQFNVSLFDRTIINFQSPSGIQTIALSDLANSLINGTIASDTIVFDPLVNTKAAFDSSFKTALLNTWMKNFI